MNVQLTDSAKPQPTTDLFEDLESWLSSPKDAYLSWIKHQDFTPSTKKVRISMWNKFCRWLESRKITLDKCTYGHVKAFIKHHALEKEQAWRYVRLIERVYIHLIAKGLSVANPGQLAGRKEGGVGNRSNDEMRFLDHSERKRLASFLQTVLSGADSAESRRQYSKAKEVEKAKIWARVRDWVITAVIYGAGCRVSELRVLSVNCTWFNGVLVVPETWRGDIKIEPHNAPMLPVAMLALKVWEFYRGDSGELGTSLFPAMVSRRRNDQQMDKTSMHPSTIFRRLRAVLAQAGLDKDREGEPQARSCGQTLRNTYAAQLMDSGADDMTLIRALGFEGDYSVQHLRQAYAAWKDRQPAGR
jgi:integrase